MEDPSPVMLNLKAVVQDTDHDPPAKQIDIAKRRQAALREAKQAFSDEDWRELCDFLWLMKRVYPDRDQALFYLGAGWPTLRRLALELGRRLVEAGTLTQLEEAMAARQAGQALPELKERVAEQRELQQARPAAGATEHGATGSRLGGLAGARPPTTRTATASTATLAVLARSPRAPAW